MVSFGSSGCNPQSGNIFCSLRNDCRVDDTRRTDTEKAVRSDKQRGWCRSDEEEGGRRGKRMSWVNGREEDVREEGGCHG